MRMVRRRGPDRFACAAPKGPAHKAYGDRVRHPQEGQWIEKYKGTSKNSASSPNAIKLPANDSASFSFRFIYVHSGAVSDRQWEQFFEVPIRDFLKFRHVTNGLVALLSRS